MDSKKLLVFSDTHGNITALESVFNWAKERIPPNDTICAAVFLGDGIVDLQIAAKRTGFSCNLKFVGGNNDYGFEVPETAVFNFADYRFFICHGHRYNLYSGYQTLITAACNKEANVALYGHSHVPFYKTLNGVHIINPGSVGRPRSMIGATFAVIECIENQPLKVDFFGIGEKGKIRTVKVKT
jgi:hypothetical protein